MREEEEEEGGKQPLCKEERQRFIDCMFIHSRCVQAGRKSFDECLREHEQQRQAVATGDSSAHNAEPFPEACAQAHHLLVRCRQQMVQKCSDCTRRQHNDSRNVLLITDVIV